MFSCCLKCCVVLIPSVHYVLDMDVTPFKKYVLGLEATTFTRFLFLSKINHERIKILTHLQFSLLKLEVVRETIVESLQGEDQLEALIYSAIYLKVFFNLLSLFFFCFFFAYSLVVDSNIPFLACI